MLADTITFGIEIESTIPRNTLRVGPHGAGFDIPQLPGWKADADPSIRSGRGGLGGSSMSSAPIALTQYVGEFAIAAVDQQLVLDEQVHPLAIRADRADRPLPWPACGIRQSDR